jgi:HK97 gp10 family phage protein
MADDLASLRAAIDKLPDAVTAQLRAIAWRYAREAKDLARSILLSKAHGHNTEGHQHTADSFVIHEEADKKQFRVAVENPDQPNLALWIERGTRFIGARPFERPANDQLYPKYSREMAAAAEGVAEKTLGVL